jgi:VWFA-related protein
MRCFLRPSSLLIAPLLTAALLTAQSGPGPEQDQAQASGDTTIRVNVDLVNIFFTVRAKKGGALIPTLEQNDFQIFEEGKPQTIKRFSKESDLPLTLGLLIDISASQENLIETERAAATEFFRSVVRPKDQALLISLGKSVDLLQDFTASPKLLTAGLRDLKGDSNAPMISGGPVPNVNTGPIGGSLGTPKGTLLFDAIYLVSNEKLKSEVGRKAIILITDGEDEGSTYKLRDAIETAQKADAIVYSIYYVDRRFYNQMGMSAGGGERDLEKISEQTGGRVFKVDRNHTLPDVFKEIQDELRNQYSISYTSLNQNRTGEFRHIEIKVDKPEDKVQARAGYYATANDVQ